MYLGTVKPASVQTQQLLAMNESVFTVDPNGSGQTSFSVHYNPSAVMVFLNGLKLTDTSIGGSDYTTNANGSLLTLTTSTLPGAVLSVVTYSQPGSSSPYALIETIFNLNTAQQDFTAQYNPATVEIFSNGVKLLPTDYTATDGANVHFLVPALANDTIDIVSK